MFAVIRAGGRQVRVAANDLVEIDLIAGDAGDTITFGEVLMLGGPDGITIGAPFVGGASVAAEIVDRHRGPKLIAFKKRRRKNSRRARGFRSHLTTVRITGIAGGDNAAPAAKGE